MRGEPGVDERGMRGREEGWGTYCGKREAKEACVEMENERREGWRGMCICCCLNGCLSWGSSGVECRFFCEDENGGSIFFSFLFFQKRCVCVCVWNKSGEGVKEKQRTKKGMGMQSDCIHRATRNG